MPEEYRKVTKETYDAIAARYAERDKGSVDEAEEVHAALDEFAALLPPGGKVLDVGCGAGRDSYFFVDQGLNVTGIDFAPRMVEQARRIVPGARFETMDFESLSFDSEFDAVWANASLHHVPKQKLPAVLGRIRQALKPDGFFFIKVKHGEGDGIRENDKFGEKIRRHFAFYGNDELERLLRDAGFMVRYLKNTTRDEWVDAVARKGDKDGRMTV